MIARLDNFPERNHECFHRITCKSSRRDFRVSKHVYVAGCDGTALGQQLAHYQACITGCASALAGHHPVFQRGAVFVHVFDLAGATETPGSQRPCDHRKRWFIADDGFYRAGFGGHGAHRHQPCSASGVYNTLMVRVSGLAYFSRNTVEDAGVRTPDWPDRYCSGLFARRVGLVE
ncbi:hypothetical protein D3C73_988600 [compost metagenome]